MNWACWRHSPSKRGGEREAEEKRDIFKQCFHEPIQWAFYQLEMIRKIIRVTRLNAIPIEYSFALNLHDAVFHMRKKDQMDDTILLIQVWYSNIMTFAWVTEWIESVVGGLQTIKVWEWVQQTMTDRNRNETFKEFSSPILPPSSTLFFDFPASINRRILWENVENCQISFLG